MNPLLILCTICWACSIFAYTVTPDLAHKTDSLFLDTASNEQQTFVKVIKDRVTVYYAVTVKTLPYPLDTIKKAVEDVANYSTMNLFIKKSDRFVSRDTRKMAPIAQNSDQAGYIDTSTFIIVMRIGFVKSWFVCRIDSAKTDQDGDYILRVKKDRDPVVNAMVRRDERGILTVEYYESSIYWKLRDLGNGTTRVALISCLEPRTWLPAWLVAVTSKVIYPSMVRDLEKYIREIHAPYPQKTDTQSSPPAPSPEPPSGPALLTPDPVIDSPRENDTVR